MSMERSTQRRPRRWWSPIFALGTVALIGSSIGCDEAGADPLAPDASTAAPRPDAGADCVPTNGWADLDGDGWGDSAHRRPFCGSQPAGVAIQPGDCDDSTQWIHPGAIELCDASDDDCDGAIDERLENREWLADEDGDGFGDPAVAVSDCAPPPGFTDAGDDCDDGRDDVHPGATERCDAVDQDCDEAIDEGALSLGETPTELGALDDHLGSVALARAGDDAIVVWVDDLRDIRAQRTDAAGTPVGAPVRIATSVGEIPSTPLAIVAGGSLFVLYRDGGAIVVRAMDLATGALAPPRSIGALDNPRPVALLEMDGVVAALWSQPGGVWLQELAPGDARLLGAPVEIAALDPTSTDTIGASAAVADPAGTLLLAVIDRAPYEVDRHVFVHRVDLRPTLALDDSPGRFELPSGAAPRTAFVVVDPALEATTPSALLFVGWGTAPDRRTQIVRFVPSNPGALGTVHPLGQPRPGMVRGAVLAPGGADWWTLEDAGLPEREAVRVHHQPLAADRGTAVGATAPLMASPSAALAPRDGARALLAYGGRISPTDITGSVWGLPVACVP